MTQQYISLPEALGTSLLGFAIVFVVLVLLIVLIWVIKKVGGEASDKPAAAPTGDGSTLMLELNGVDDRTAATLMALTADKMKAPQNELRFISIREIKK